MSRRPARPAPAPPVDEMFGMMAGVVEEMLASGYEPRSIAPPGGPSDGTRKRRNADDLARLLTVVRHILSQQSGRISVRHLFYLTVSAGVIEKTERGYANLKHQLTKWRRAGLIA